MPFMDEASTAIRAAGGRFTPQRRLIVELLEDAQSHLDADKVYHLAHERDESISMATVYRTLHVLKEAGLIDQRYFSPDHERTYYEPAESGEHYHFTCQGCGQVIEFETRLVEKLKRELEAAQGVRLTHACLCLEGLCRACQAAGRTGEGKAHDTLP